MYQRTGFYKVPLPVTPGQEAAGVVTALGPGAMLQGITAQYLTTTTYPWKAGDTCLVHAAAGGTGLLLCQLAKRKGARVLATVSTEEKAALAREAGADEVIRYTEQDFEVEMKRLTGGRGLQVVYDSVGKTTFAQGLELPRAARDDGAVRSVEWARRTARAPNPDPEGLAVLDTPLTRGLHRDPRRAARARPTCWGGSGAAA